MKKTVTTMLSLALAMILVSSLGNGVILADDDDEKKDRRRGREVVIFDCAKIVTLTVIFVTAVDSSMGAPMIEATTDPEDPVFCAQTFADLLNAKFKVEDITTVIDLMDGLITTRYTMIKK